MFKTRLFHSRSRRVQDWQGEMEQRMRSITGGANSQEISEERPAISVCMATYNGERYVRAQISSILSQLSGRDELIIVDDASTDRTCEMIESLCDERIRLKRRTMNQGVLRSFEDAIRCANGDILFLSDQDDLWTKDKVSTTLHAFHMHPEVDIAVSDANLIDDDNHPLGGSYYAQRGKFRPGILSNLIHCSYLGCTMAFRRRIRPIILPFPAGADVFHDLWIGAANALAGGKALYIDRPLMLYRRHRGNATGNRRLPIKRQIRMRWDLCRSLAQLWWRSHPLIGGRNSESRS
jgi:glycosyltransferase involved in cell wall biosynthesis